MSSSGSKELHLVVLAGGSGTRFWPLSRRARPKQLLCVGAEQTLLGGTFERLASLAPVERWWMVVGAAHAEACHKAVPAVRADRVLVEPWPRNTAPAVALAAIHIAHATPQAVMAVLPADHHVADKVALGAAITQAASAAQEGAIATLGITPTQAETGYGYIERGDPDPRGGYRVRRFCEKPNRQTAEQFLSAGTFAWNAGIFVMRVDVFLAELARQLPDHHTAFCELGASLGREDFSDRLSATYQRLSALSIDHGIMEGARDLVVIPVECGWSDVGSFGALAALDMADAAGNVARGRVVTVESSGCFVAGEPDHAVALLGVSDLVVVQTADATLVLPKSRAQEVKAVVAALSERGWTEFL